LRIFSAYGEGLKRQLFFDIATKATSASKQGESEIVLFGTGEESRDFIHGEDVARAALLVSEKESTEYWEAYNVASGREVQVKDAATEFLRILGLNVTCRFNGTVRTGDPRFWRADVGKIQNISFAPSISLSTGLGRYAAWLKEERHIQDRNDL
jgi:nucleoside-diphosphate-sugar epimerase